MIPRDRAENHQQRSRRSRSSRLPAIADLLRIAEGSQVISRNQRRYVDGHRGRCRPPSTRWASCCRGPSRLIEAVDIKPGTVQLPGRDPRPEASGLSRLDHRAGARRDRTQFFNLPQDGRIGIFEIFRTAFDQTGTPMRLTVSVYPTDRNQFVINVGDMPESASPAG